MSVTAEKTVAIGGVPHYLARAATPTTSGVLLIPHVTGIDHFVTDFADTLAARGLTTLAWNPYPDLPMGASFTERPPRPKDEAAVAWLSRCLEWMQRECGLTKIGSIGFCMGGRFGLLFAAKEPRLACLVAAYPTIPPQHGPDQDIEPVPTAAAIACPVQVVWPGQDHITKPPTFQALAAMLLGRDAHTSLVVYPTAGHGFMHAPSPENDAATKTCRPQVYAFLDAHLTE